MLRALLLLLAGEGLLLYGLWLAWAPLAFVAAGTQLAVGAWLYDDGKPAKTGADA